MIELLERQKAYFATGATLPVKSRIAALKKLKAVILARESEINEALKKDLGKSGFESYMCEVGMTAAMVVSLPVPAVVGTAMNRGSLPNTFNTPRILLSVRLGFIISAPAPFAQSIAEPPPTAIRQSQPCSLNSFAASSQFEVVGFATVSEYTQTAIPLAFSACSKGAHSPILYRFLSVTRSAFFLPSDASSSAAALPSASGLGWR